MSYVITTSFYRDMPEDYCVAESKIFKNFFNVHIIPEQSGCAAEDLFDFNPIRYMHLSFDTVEVAYNNLDVWRAMVCDWINANTGFNRFQDLKKHLDWAGDVLIYIENLLVVEVEDQL